MNDIHQKRPQQRNQRIPPPKIKMGIIDYCKVFSVLGPILFTVLIPTINANLPQWTNYNHNHPMVMPVIWGATLIGLLGAIAYLTLLVNKFKGYKISIISIMVLGVFFTWNGFLLFVCFSRWHGWF